MVSSPPDLQAIAGAQILFGRFCVIPQERLLLRDGVPVDIGGRALDLLIALVDRPGRVLSKRELLKRVWHDTIVEEGSLRFHMTSLRKILGDGEPGMRYISTQVGVGYAFVAPIERHLPENEPAWAAPYEDPSDQAKRSSVAAGALPPKGHLIGREADVELILDRLREPRLFTIAGTGGVGKTSLAVEIGHRIANGDDRRVRFVDLAQVEDPSLVPYALASALHIPVQADDPMQVVIAHIRSEAWLLIVDNCEHLIDTVSGLLERIREGAPRVGVLATSREPLRARNEHVHWLGALGFPAEPDDASAEQLLGFPAVELFIERASAGNASFRLDAKDARMVADMCRRLEGIALPIELAAMRVGTHGVSATHALLGERFSLGWAGRRTALPRQQTLRATLDWSYDLLGAAERLTFDRLSVFVGPFSLDAAADVVADARIDPVVAIATLDGLVAKGLVTMDHSDTAGSYRLLEMTRAYAKEKLIALGGPEVRAAALRHAMFYLNLLEDLGSSPEEVFDNADRLGSQLGNIRSALEWSFGPQGDASIAVPLAAASAQLFLQFSLLVECRSWCGRATDLLEGEHVDTAIEMELQAALGLVLMFTRGNTGEAGTALRRALAIAASLGDHWNQLRILGRLQIFDERIGDFAGSLAWAEQASEVGAAIGRPEAVAVAASLAGVSLHLLGEQERARRQLEISLDNSMPSERSRTIYYGFDHRNRSCIALARTCWLQGLPDQARHWVRQALSEAIVLDHPVTYCIALIWTLSVYIWTGETDKATASLKVFAETAQSNLFKPYIAAAHGFKGVIAVSQENPEEAVRWIAESLARLQGMHYGLLTTSFEKSLTDGLILAGRHTEAMKLVRSTIEHCERNGDAFAMPELLRIEANILRSLGGDLAAVESMLLDSLALSRRQASHAWGLRTAMDLAQLRLEQGRTTDARDVVQYYRDTLSEGFDTMDVKRFETFWAESFA